MYEYVVYLLLYFNLVKTIFIGEVLFVCSSKVLQQSIFHQRNNENQNQGTQNVSLYFERIKSDNDLFGFVFVIFVVFVVVVAYFKIKTFKKERTI